MKRRERPLPTAAIPLIGALLLAAMSCRFEGDNRSDVSGNRPAGRSSGGSKTNEAQSAAGFVGNSFCRACHLDFDGEQLALDHERAGIGCERCHGESLRHRSDEANVTPPELMYPKERINPTCMMCHPRNDINHVEDHRRILEAGLSVFEEAPSDASAGKFCTDCHGQKHRMQNRTTRWDKATGALIR